MLFPLSDLEMRIIAALREDPRMTVTELSRKVGASRPTILKSIRKLVSSGEMLLCCGVNAKEMDIKMAQVGIQVRSPSARAGIVEALSKCPHVVNIFRVTDGVNLLVQVWGREEAFITSLANCIGDLEDVEVKYCRQLGTPLVDTLIPMIPGDNSSTPCGKNCRQCQNLANNWCDGCYPFEAV